MPDTRLGWKTAVTHADTLVTDANLTRGQHLDLFKSLLESRHSQDHRIALALLRLFVKRFPDDFDRDVSLDDLIEYGVKLCRPHWKDFGRQILLPVLKRRSVPSEWIDRIADEESKPLRQAFAIALEELGKRKRIPLERTLGILRYFLDDPSVDVRDGLVKALKRIGERDPERLHYFLAAHEEGAGSNRLALIGATRESLGWEASE